MIIAVGAVVAFTLFSIKRMHRYHAAAWHPVVGWGPCGGHGHGHGHHHGHHHGQPGMYPRHGLHRLRHALRRLETTPAQERALRQEWKDLRKLAYHTRGELAGLRGELGAVLAAPALDRAALDAALGRVDQAYATMRTATADALTRVHAALDDEQRVTLGKLLGATRAPAPAPATPPAPSDGPFR